MRQAAGRQGTGHLKNIVRIQEKASAPTKAKRHSSRAYACSRHRGDELLISVSVRNFFVKCSVLFFTSHEAVGLHLV